MCVVEVFVRQMIAYVLATVMSVLVVVQHIAVQQVLAYALATVMPALVVVQHIAVQQTTAYVRRYVRFARVQVRLMSVITSPLAQRTTPALATVAALRLVFALHPPTRFAFITAS